MAQQDKTDWYWNGVLAGAVNNLYYDLINVDVVHTPYSTTNRNSSFFLQTRQSYIPSDKWNSESGRDVVDTQYVWDKTCEKNNGFVYILLTNNSRTKIRISVLKVENGCVVALGETGKEYQVHGCGNFKLFSTSYVKGGTREPRDVIYYDDEGPDECHPEDELPEYTGIQINKISGGTTYGLFSDEIVESGAGQFRRVGSSEDCPEKGIAIGDYILVYESADGTGNGHAGQVRMVIGREGNRILVDSPWLGFKTPDGEKEIKGDRVKYKVFKDWGKTVGFTDGHSVYIVNAFGESGEFNFNVSEVYVHKSVSSSKVISVADVADRIYILTDKGRIHYSKEVGYNKFFIEDDIFAGADKLALTEYRDILIAFGDKHIAVGVPTEGTQFTNLYNQSATVGLWSRYSFAEYDGDLIFVSNDKRLLALGIANNSGKYMLQYEDVGDMVNSKLSTLNPGDEVFVGNDDNDLRIFIQTKSWPFYNTYEEGEEWMANLTGIATENKYRSENTMTRVIKFNKQFKVWTEDLVQGILLEGVNGGIYFGENGLYKRSRGASDIKNIIGDSLETREYPFKTYISAYLVENESDWVGGTSSRLANRPKLYNLAKLNRLITTLGPGIYTHDTKLRVTSYVKGLGRVYEFSIDGGNNDWLGFITDKFQGLEPSEGDVKKLECLNSVLQDVQKAYQPKCVGKPNGAIQNLVQQQPWCDNYDELLTYDKGVCIDDSLYELAPTMPLTTDLGENQDYSTQIKLELIGCSGDIITFGGRLGEMFVAPLFTKGPDGEYQLQPNTDC